jgi:hypothetical protein
VTGAGADHTKDGQTSLSKHAGVHWSSAARNRKEWKNLAEQLKNKKELKTVLK